MTKGLVIYDLDGTLLDSEPTVSRIDSEALTEAGVAVTFDDVHSLMKGFSSKTKYEMACDLKNQPVSEEVFAAYYARRSAAVAELYDRHDIRLHRGIPSILRFLKKEDFVLCIGSNNTQDRARKAVRKFRLSPYFNDKVFTSDQVAQAKPAPDLFLHAAKTMRFPVERCLVVGDTIADVLGAVAANMNVAVFTAGEKDSVSSARLKAAGATVVLPRHTMLKTHIYDLLPQ